MAQIMKKQASGIGQVLIVRGSNVGLRGITIFSRFALIMGCARILEPAQLGLLGLFIATINYGVLLVGGDYYTYAQRELLSEPRSRWSFVLQHQLLATAALYLIIFPVQFILFWLGLLPMEMMWWFLGLLFFEHFAQELNRALIAMQHQLWASWILFFRRGIWVWVVLAVMWKTPELRTLETIFVGWLIGAAFACIGGAAIIVKRATPWKRWTIDWQWILRGYPVGLLFLVSTLCLKGITTFDRYMVQGIAGEDILGAYVFYSGIAILVISFLGFSVSSFVYPRLVAAYSARDQMTYKRTMREFAWSATSVSLVMAIGIILAAPWVMEWTGKSIYAEHIPVLWILVSGTVLYGISMVPHYGLYAAGKDRSIVFCHATSLLVFTVVALALSHWPNAKGIAVAQLVAFAWMLFAKTAIYKHNKIGRFVSVSGNPA